MDKNHTALQRIAQQLYRTNIQDIGLISGKMGYIIFLFHYARYSREKHYENRALELLHEIQHHLSDNTKKSYGHGIAGIGIAIDYLIENEFIIADEDILDDLDRHMYVAIDGTITDYSMYNGLVGIGWYWLSRTHKKFARSILSKILFLIRENNDQLTITERYDTYNFLFELNCTPFFGQNISKALKLFRFHYLRNELNESYPRLFNSFAGDEARKHLLKRYWQFDWYATSPPLVFSEEDLNTKTLAWDGLYLLSVLSPRDKSWIGLL